MRKISDDVRQVIIIFIIYGHSVKYLSEILGYSKKTIKRIFNEYCNGLIDIDNVKAKKELMIRGLVKPHRCKHTDIDENSKNYQPSLFDEIIFQDVTNNNQCESNTGDESTSKSDGQTKIPVNKKQCYTVCNKGKLQSKEEKSMFESNKFISICNKLKQMEIIKESNLIETAITIYKSKNYKVDPIKVLECLNEKPDMYLREIARKMKCSKSAIHKVLKKLNIRLKVKNIVHYKSDPHKRIDFLHNIIKHKKEGYDIVYIDESSFRHYYSRRKHYAMKGDNRPCDGRWEKYQQSSVIGAMIKGKFVSIGVFECSIDAKIFKSFIEKILLPALKRKSVIVMDNAAIHKRPDIIELIESSGNKVEFLPSYSPQLNPIEQGWNWVKEFMASYNIASVYDTFSLILKHKCFKSMYEKISCLGDNFNIKTYIEQMKHLEHAVM